MRSINTIKACATANFTNIDKITAIILIINIVITATTAFMLVKANIHLSFILILFRHAIVSIFVDYFNMRFRRNQVTLLLSLVFGHNPLLPLRLTSREHLKLILMILLFFISSIICITPTWCLGAMQQQNNICKNNLTFLTILLPSLFCQILYLELVNIFATYLFPLRAHESALYLVENQQYSFCIFLSIEAILFIRLFDFVIFSMEFTNSDLSLISTRYLEWFYPKFED